VLLSYQGAPKALALKPSNLTLVTGDSEIGGEGDPKGVDEGRKEWFGVSRPCMCTPPKEMAN
jgi:hypothetical protein